MTWPENVLRVGYEPTSPRWNTECSTFQASGPLTVTAWARSAGSATRIHRPLKSSTTPSTDDSLGLCARGWHARVDTHTCTVLGLCLRPGLAAACDGAAVVSYLTHYLQVCGEVCGDR